MNYMNFISFSHQMPGFSYQMSHYQRSIFVYIVVYLGADPTLRDIDGNLPIDLARSGNIKEMIKSCTITEEARKGLEVSYILILR